MTDSIHIPANEREVIRVFAIDLPPKDIEPFVTRDADGRWPMKDALGADALDPDRVEVFAVSDLAGLGLAGYLSQGLGVAAADIAPVKARLDAMTGHVAVLTSAALEGKAQTLRPHPPILHVATFHERAAPPAGPPLRADSAEGVAGSPARANQAEPTRRLPRGAISGLILAALIVAGLLFWALAGGQP